LYNQQASGQAMNIHSLRSSSGEGDTKSGSGSQARIKPGDFPIYHERQQSALCGQHALNNLLQGAFFTPMDLAEVAQQLDAEERAVMMEGASANNLSKQQLEFLADESSNVDASGNFSSQVLSVAIKRSHQIDLVVWAGAGAGSADASEGEGYIVNRSEHWFAVRKLNGKWWNLNSTLERPELISPFYLSAFLAQLRSDGYTVFLPSSAKLPPVGNRPNLDDSDGGYAQQMGTWYGESDLLSPTTSSSSGGAGDMPKSFSGQGRRLGGDPPPPAVQMESTGDADLDAAILASLGGGGTGGGGVARSEDEELQMALAMSMSSLPISSSSSTSSTSSSSSLVPGSKEEMRAKRLAALSKPA